MLLVPPSIPKYSPEASFLVEALLFLWLLFLALPPPVPPRLLLPFPAFFAADFLMGDEEVAAVAADLVAPVFLLSSLWSSSSSWSSSEVSVEVVVVVVVVVMLFRRDFCKRAFCHKRVLLSKYTSKVLLEDFEVVQING